MKVSPPLVATLVVAALALASCGGRSSGGGHDQTATLISGVNFSAFVDGQDPTRGDKLSESQVRQRLQVLVGHTDSIRTFGSTNGLEVQACVARALGFKTAIGAWLDRDVTANESEISNLVNAARANCVDLAIVGSEALFRGDLTADALVAYINDIRTRIGPLAIPVTTVERFPELRAHPEIIDAVDVVLVNYYPFWDGIAIDDAVPVLHDWHLQLKSLAGAKEIVVSETGWPDAGQQIGDAVPSDANADLYFLTFASWARAEHVRYFYFEAFDEAWKVSQEGAVGAHWGIWDSQGVLKAGRGPVFDGRTVPDTWTPKLIDGPGTPTIEFTSVSPIGDVNGFARGRVSHVSSSAHRVAVFIRVRGTWWTKPTFESPLTSIAPNGNWTADIVTGGVDEEADRVAAFLVASDYHPPPCGGCLSLPASLDENALARAEFERVPR